MISLPFFHEEFLSNLCNIQKITNQFSMLNDYFELQRIGKLHELAMKHF
jgi:hypothetical protein